MEENCESQQERPPQQIKCDFEKIGDVSLEHEAILKDTFLRAAVSLSKEWGLTSTLEAHVVVMSDEKFREGTKPPDPWSKKYCFLLRDQDENRVYVNAAVLTEAPEIMESMIRHELSHVVVGQLVGDGAAYRRSFVLEEGTAGLDHASALLVEKIKREGIKEIPNPLSIGTLAQLKALGGDTNLEPFTDQIGYLVLFSFVQFLKERHGGQALIEVYKKLNEQVALEEAFREISGREVSGEMKEWRVLISELVNA